MEFKVRHDRHVLKHQIWLRVTVSRILLNIITQFIKTSYAHSLWARHVTSPKSVEIRQLLIFSLECFHLNYSSLFAESSSYFAALFACVTTLG